MTSSSSGTVRDLLAGCRIHVFTANTRHQRPADLSEFENGLVYIVTSQTAGATEKKPVSSKQEETSKQVFWKKNRAGNQKWSRQRDKPRMVWPPALYNAHRTWTLLLQSSLKSFFMLFPLGSQLQKQLPSTLFTVTSKEKHSCFCLNSRTCFKRPWQANSIHPLLTVGQVECICLLDTLIF